MLRSPDSHSNTIEITHVSNYYSMQVDSLFKYMELGDRSAVWGDWAAVSLVKTIICLVLDFLTTLNVSIPP